MNASQRAAILLYDMADSIKRFDEGASEELQSCLIRYCRDNGVDLDKVRQVVVTKATEWPGGAVCNHCGYEFDDEGLCHCHREQPIDSTFTLGLEGR